MIWSSMVGFSWRDSASAGEPPQHSPGGENLLEKCGTLVFRERAVGEGEVDGVAQRLAGDQRREQAEFLRRQRLIPDGILVAMHGEMDRPGCERRDVPDMAAFARSAGIVG